MAAILLAMTLLADPAAMAIPFPETADSTTELTIQLQLERIRMLEHEVLMHESHPAVQLQKVKVRERETALYAMLAKGYEIDQARVHAKLDVMLELTRSELDAKSILYSPNHPELALLELRLRAIQRIQARRTLLE